MKSKFLFTASLIGLVTFLFSELFFSELLIFNTAISLGAFLFLPLLVDKLFQLKFHFASIYLSYLGAYIVITFIAKIFGIDIFFMANLARILVVIGTFAAASILVLQLNKEVKIKYAYILVLIAATIAAFILSFVIIRQSGSIVALDSLQHQAVVNQIYSDLKICLLPSQCNNLFLKDGYTTIYHSILFFVSPSDYSIEERLYTLDIVWLTLSAISIFIFARKFINHNFVASIAAAIPLFIFVNGSYEFSFFIPQTFTFFIFLISYKRELFKKKEFIALSIILIMCHLIMGAFLVTILGLMEFVKRRMVSIRPLTVVGILSLLFTILLSSLNLTIEKIFQSAEVEFLGDYTNKEFPINFGEFININPVLLTSFAVITGLFLANRIKRNGTSILIPIAFFLASTYFIAPTYANKFLIGIGVFVSIVIVDTIFRYIWNLNYQRIILGLIFAVSILSYLNNYRFYLTFYKTGEDTISVLNKKESGLITFLRQTELECVIVTDPFTQIAITGLTRFETANAQYMNPEYRKIIHNFLQDPSASKLGNVLTYPGYKQTCFIYSYRLEEARVENIDMWANQIYYYVVDSTRTLNSEIDPVQLLDTEMDLVYKDKYYYVYR